MWHWDLDSTLGWLILSSEYLWRSEGKMSLGMVFQLYLHMQINHGIIVYSIVLINTESK